MPILTILAVALGLAMDAFAVAISTGVVLPRLSLRTVFRLSWHFGLFQFLMPVLGWLAGRSIHRFIADYDHWIAFTLLSFIGGKMIYESFRNREEEHKLDPTRGLTMVVLSVATSIDALAVGLSMGVMGLDIWLPSIIIGLVAALMTALGMFLGRRLGKLFGKRMELLGGIILLLIGAKILAEHLGLL